MKPGQGDQNLFFRMKTEDLYSPENLNMNTRKLFFGEVKSLT
jgi:hypothetical protein